MSRRVPRQSPQTQKHTTALPTKLSVPLLPGKPVADHALASEPVSVWGTPGPRLSPLGPPVHTSSSSTEPTLSASSLAASLAPPASACTTPPPVTPSPPKTWGKPLPRQPILETAKAKSRALTPTVNMTTVLSTTVATSTNTSTISKPSSDMKNWSTISTPAVCVAFQQGKCARAQCNFSHIAAVSVSVIAQKPSPATLLSLLQQLFKQRLNSELSFRIRIVFSRCLGLSTPKAKQLVQTLSGLDARSMVPLLDSCLKPVSENDAAHIQSSVGALRGVIKNLGLTPVSVLEEIYCTDSESESEPAEREARPVRAEPQRIATDEKSSSDSNDGSGLPKDMESVPTHYENTHNNNNSNNSGLAYLDVGVGLGHVASAVGQLLRANSISGLDVVEFSKNVIKDRTKIYDGVHIPFEDNSFDVVSTFQVLHHVENVPALLPELFRVLKPGGSLLLKEHDACDRTTFNLVLLEHALHDYRRVGLGLERLIETPVSLKSKEEWDIAVREIGFSEYRSTTAGQLNWRIPKESAPPLDPTRSFFARWVKPNEATIV